MVVWTPGMTLERLEHLVVQAAFKHYRENKCATAASLGVAVRTLDSKLEKIKQDEDTLKAAEAERRAANEAFLARARGAPPVMNAIPSPPAEPASQSAGDVDTCMGCGAIGSAGSFNASSGLCVRCSASSITKGKTARELPDILKARK